MFRVFAYILLLAGIMLQVQSCKHYPDQPIPQIPSDTSVTIPCDPDTVYFTEIQAILSSNCLHSGCHNAVDQQGEVNLTSYAKIMQTADVVPGNPGESDLYDVVTETDPDKKMPQPPYNSLSAEQQEKIRIWIQQGAKNNHCDGCDTTAVTYSNQVENIIQSNCFSCHNNTLQSDGVNLEGYANLKTYADNGKLLGVIKRDVGFKPMPYNGNKLDDCKIRTIEIWIENGAQNN